MAAIPKNIDMMVMISDHFTNRPKVAAGCRRALFFKICDALFSLGMVNIDYLFVSGTQSY
jgi:hypothetical protein